MTPEMAQVATLLSRRGFVIATLDTFDASARALAAATPAIIVSVEYCKAPEAPFPAAYNDALASY